MVNRGEPCKSQSSKAAGITGAQQLENVRPKFSACVQERWDQGRDSFSQHKPLLRLSACGLPPSSQIKQSFYRAWKKESCVYTPVLPFRQLFSDTANSYNTGENQSHFEPKRLTEAPVSKSFRCPGGSQAT